MRFAVGDGKLMYIIIIRFDVISIISIIINIIEILNSLFMVSRASGAAGLNVFLGLRNLNLLGNGRSIWEGGGGSCVGLLQGFAGKVLPAAPCEISAPCSTAPCGILAPCTLAPCTDFPTSEYVI